MTATTTPDLGRALAITRSAYGTAHRAAPDSPLGKALRTLPAWTDAHDQLVALPVSSRFAPGPAAGDAAVDDLVTQALAAGKPLDTLTEDAVRVHAAAQGPALVHQAVARLRERLTGDLDDAVTHGRDKVLGNLDDQLQQLLDRARALLKALGGIRDSEAAVDAGVLDELREWRQLVDLHARVREGQALVMGSTDSQGRSINTRVHAHLAAPEQTDTDYLARLIGCQVEEHGKLRPAKPAPWPDSWRTEAALEWCALLAESRPWVPTPAQLTEAEERVEVARVQLSQTLGRLPVSSRALTRAEMAGALTDTPAGATA